MKKLVIGIISVFLTQVVFIAYNWTGDELAADVGRVSEHQVEREPWPIIRSVRPPYPETIVDADEPDLTPPAPVITPKVQLASYKPAPKTAKRNTFMRNDLKFEPTVITYSTLPVKFTERPQISGVPEPETVKASSAQPITKKKRTFLQKTGSVIKKPFVWLKDLVARND